MTKQEQAQAELFKADVSWFHIFKEIIRNKTWARLSSNAKSLYPVIKAYINWESGAAFPSIDTLQEYSGLARASVIKALKELEKEGLLIKLSSGRTSNYTVVEKFSVQDDEGRPAASVSFDYLPAYVSDAVTELKNFVAQGLVLPDGKTNFIKIDNLVLNIAHGGGNAINVQSPMDARLMLKGIRDMLDKKDTDEARMINELVKVKP